MTDPTPPTPAQPAAAPPIGAPSALTEVKAVASSAVATVEAKAATLWSAVKSHAVVAVAGGVAGHLTHGIVTDLLAKLF